MGARHTTMPARALGVVAAVVIAGAPLLARAQAPAPAPQATEPAPATESEPTPPVAAPLTAPPAQPQDELVAPPNNVSQSAGMGTAVATDDPEAHRAKSELEGTALTERPAQGIPERLPPLQRGGWWCVFGGFAFASVGGVFAGLAETEEDRATRLVAQLNPQTGGSLPYSEVRGEYEQILARGRRDAILAQTFLAAGGAVLAAGIGLFIADRVKRRPARVRASLGGLQVHF